MKRNFILILLSVCLALSSFACGTSESPSKNNQETSSENAPETTPEPTCYPKELDSPLYDYATLPPNVIYTTPESENGLRGSVYYVTGKVTQVVSSDDSDLGFAYFSVATENGEVYFVDIVSSIVSSTSDEEVKAYLLSLYGSEYTFPQIDEDVTSYGLYSGFSDLFKAPILYFGINENLQNFMLENDGESFADEKTDIVENESEIYTDASNAIEEENPRETVEITLGQKNALRKANDYLDLMAFSYSGLIDQLKYEGFTTEEATYAVDNCGADWNEQAAIRAKNYTDMTAFSRSKLIDQLKYEGFTSEQAEYGVSAIGY